jgi:xylulokinase
MKEYILAHDLGTSGNKATLFNRAGALISSAFAGYPTEYPRPGWAEQDPRAWWRAVSETTHQLLTQSKISPADIAVVSFTGQMQGCLPVDAVGEPLHPCIIWSDQRSVAQAHRLVERLGEERVYRITGHRISPTYSASKIMWLRDNKPELFARTEKVLHVKDYIAYRMTGVFATDRSDASGMNLYDLEQGAWSDEILSAIDLDPRLLPEIHNSVDVVGQVTPDAASELGLAGGTPVVIGGGDGASAAVGAGAVKPGLAYNNLGSSAWISFASPRPLFDPARRIFNFAHMVPGLYAPCGTMQSAGAAYQWLRRQVCQVEGREADEAGLDVYHLMNQRAAESEPGSHGLLFLPYLQGERSPYWNPHARGGWIGLQITHTRADLIRAVLEGISLNLRAILDAFLENGARIDEVLLIGGGAKGELWRQILADVYGRPVLRPRLLDEATSLGAAIAGGVGVGLFPDFSVADRFVEIVDRQLPQAEAQAVYERLYPVFLAAYQALVPVFDQLQQATDKD